MAKRKSKFTILFITILGSLLLTSCSGSSDSIGDLNSSSNSSTNEQKDNRGLAGNSTTSDGGSIIDLSGGESEKVTRLQIENLFTGSYLKHQLQLVYHRIHTLRKKDKESNLVINTFHDQDEDYFGLHDIIDRLFDPQEDPEQLNQNIFAKIYNITFNLRDDAQGRECYGEYHMLPNSPLEGKPDWRDMSINHKTKEICVSIPRFLLTDSNKLYERVMAVLAMETSHLMGFDRDEANLLRDWFVRHPFIILSNNNKFVPIYQELESIDYLLSQLTKKSILDGNQASVCRIVDQIIDRHDDLKLKILSIQDPQHIKNDNNFYNRVFVPRIPGARSNNGRPNKDITENILSGVSEIGFHSSLVYDIFNTNNLENYILAVDPTHNFMTSSYNKRERGCEYIDPLKIFTRADKQNVLNIYREIVKYYQDIYEQIVTYQYPDLGSRTINNPMSFLQAYNLVKVDNRVNRFTQGMGPASVYPFTTQELSCNFKLLSNEGEVLREKTIIKPTKTIMNPTEKNAYDDFLDLETAFDDEYKQEPFVHLKQSEFSDLTLNQPYTMEEASIVGLMAYSFDIDGHIVGIYPHNLKSKLNIQEVHTQGTPLVYNHNYLFPKTTLTSDFSWNTIPLQRIHMDEFTFHIDNQGLLIPMHPETNPQARALVNYRDVNGLSYQFVMDCSY